MFNIHAARSCGVEIDIVVVAVVEQTAVRNHAVGGIGVDKAVAAGVGNMLLHRHCQSLRFDVVIAADVDGLVVGACAQIFPLVVLVFVAEEITLRRIDHITLGVKSHGEQRVDRVDVDLSQRNGSCRHRHCLTVFVDQRLHVGVAFHRKISVGRQHLYRCNIGADIEVDVDSVVVGAPCVDRHRQTLVLHLGTGKIKFRAGTCEGIISIHSVEHKRLVRKSDGAVGQCAIVIPVLIFIFHDILRDQKHTPGYEIFDIHLFGIGGVDISVCVVGSSKQLCDWRLLAVGHQAIPAGVRFARLDVDIPHQIARDITEYCHDALYPYAGACRSPVVSFGGAVSRAFCAFSGIVYCHCLRFGKRGYAQAVPFGLLEIIYNSGLCHELRAGVVVNFQCCRRGGCRCRQ